MIGVSLLESVLCQSFLSSTSRYALTALYFVLISGVEKRSGDWSIAA